MPFWFLLTSTAVLGAIWGSFVAALCSRWPSNESVAKGRSRCDRCGRQIASFDLIPVISYLLLRGRCRECGQKIDPMALAVELAAASIGAVAVLLLPADQAVATAIFGWLLMPLVILDYKHLWLPDRLVLLLAAAGLLIGPIFAPDISLIDRLIGMSAGFLGLEAVRLIYKALRQSEGMGAGDPKMFGALGIWLGWQALPVILLVASGIGIASFLALRVKASHRQTAFPFGSYLGVAAFLAALA